MIIREDRDHNPKPLVNAPIGLVSSDGGTFTISVGPHHELKVSKDEFEKLVMVLYGKAALDAMKANGAP